MRRYRIRIIKKYHFDLNSKDKESVNNQIKTLMNESNILDLPYVKKDIKVKISRIRKGKK